MQLSNEKRIGHDESFLPILLASEMISRTRQNRTNNRVGIYKDGKTLQQNVYLLKASLKRSID